MSPDPVGISSSLAPNSQTKVCAPRDAQYNRHLHRIADHSDEPDLVSTVYPPNNTYVVDANGQIELTPLTWMLVIDGFSIVGVTQYAAVSEQALSDHQVVFVHRTYRLLLYRCLSAIGPGQL
jgi:hypothetical protein